MSSPQHLDIIMNIMEIVKYKPINQVVALQYLMEGKQIRRVYYAGSYKYGFGNFDSTTKTFEWDLPLGIGNFQNVDEILVWRTYDGRELLLDEIPHQHISNIFHYNSIMGMAIPDAITKQIKKRYNGDILDYRPDPKFKGEIRMLKQKGMLIKISDQAYDIMYKSHIIGRLVSNEDIVF